MQIPFLSDEKQSGNVPNTRSQRAKCWESRDKFFGCLDSIDVVDSLKDSNQPQIKKHCSSELKEFNKDCITSWIHYFQEKRVTDWQKQQYMQRGDDNTDNNDKK